VDDRSSAFLANLVEFGRVLRSAGLTATTEQLRELVTALSWVGLDDRDRVYRVARSILVKRKEDLRLFRELFDWFWTGAAQEGGAAPRTMPRAPRHRVSTGFTVATYMAFKARNEMTEMDVVDRSGAFSNQEILQRKWFGEMTPEELDEVRKLMRDLDWSAGLRTTRRYVPDDRGPSVDLRRVLRRASRLGSVPSRLPRRRRAEKQRPVILLADISGSMEKYSRLVLQFFHAVVSSLSRVETFVFATRLTRLTPQLRLRNLDQALHEASREVVDWAGGTRIGACLGAFNRQWGRRLLRRGAVVVIVSDGCDREDPEALAREMRHLQHRCHRLIWLNPFSGHEHYEARTRGMAAALPFVDSFLPIHNVQALQEFSTILARIPPSSRRPGRRLHPASEAKHAHDPG
jgi:uncharacterized protein with von Willebrand factor type A (vWA) domain